ncbi:MAG TPA: glycosyltransferase family 9 protein [Fimbriimonadaceae bacterium]|nr:glycosyltransferase family 9 protein [Fimbriimonadaceae bacterium]
MASYLIVRFSAIGDCVMAAYTATAIREKEPDATIDWAIETRCRPVLNEASLINSIIDFPRDEWRRRGWPPSVWREQLSRFSALRKRRYEFGMDLQGHSKTAICLRIARPKRRIAAFATDALSARLNPLLPGDPDSVHRVERMLHAAQYFGDFGMPAAPIMPTYPAVISAKPRLVSMSTGAGAKVKQYPSEQWAQVGAALIAEGFKVALLGASSDPKIAIRGAEDYVGKLSLSETMSVVAASTVHLAADTGTGHIAAAYGVPFVSVFGPTDPDLYRPYSLRGEVLRKSENPGDVSPEVILESLRRLVG